MSGRLFLSGGEKEDKSYAIDEMFLKKIKKILYIPIAWPNEDFKSCKKWFSSNVLKAHKNENTKIKMLTDLNKPIKINDYGAVFIGGGNTFKLLKKIKESGFDKKLAKYYRSGGTIYGGSAGAIIFGKDISTASMCKDADVNEVKLKNTSGMNLVKGYDVQCHFEDNQIKKHKEYIKKSKRNIICIPGRSCLLIEGNKIKGIGLKPITIITKTKTNKFNPNSEIKLK